MAGYVEDRWYRKGPVDPKTGKATRVPTALGPRDKKPGKGMRYKVTGIPGVRARSFPDGQLTAARAWLKAAATDSTRGEFTDPRDGNITLREYVEKYWWPTLRVPPTTKESMEDRVFGHILPHMGSMPLNRIGHDEIKWWMTRAEQNIDVSTLRTTWRHFSKIMQAATKAKRIPANPFRDEDLQAPSLPKSKAKAWPRETVAGVKAALPDRYRILVDLAVGAGLRQGETFGFSPNDMDGDVIHVTRQVVKVRGKLAFAPPKGNKEREAPCPPELEKAVKAYMDAFESVDVTLPWVDPDRPNLPWEERPTRTVRLLVTSGHWAGRGGGALNRTTWDEKQWKPALVRAGLIPEPTMTRVEDVKYPYHRKEWKMPRGDGFHVLRHTFASVVLHSGETIAKLAEWLGHADPAFTLRTYIHFLPKSGSRGMAALGAWLASDGGAPEADVAPDDFNSP